MATLQMIKASLAVHFQVYAYLIECQQSMSITLKHFVSSTRTGRHATGARCKVLRCVEWGGPNRGPKRYRQPGTPYDQVVDQRVQGNANLTAGIGLLSVCLAKQAKSTHNACVSRCGYEHSFP